MFQEVSCDRRICDFPKPFRMDCTPYKERVFSKFAYDNLELETSFKVGGCLKICKIIIVGDASVGKTCIVNRFCHKIFDTNYKSTIGVDFEVEKFHILNVDYNLQIWDTAGQERFKSIAQSYYRGAHVIVLVFDLSNPGSLSNCEVWLNEALQTSPSKRPLLFLVGTKHDLLKNLNYNHMERSSMKLAEKLKAEYWIVSSKTGKNIVKLFQRIAALAFEESIKLEYDRRHTEIEIGTPLLVLEKKKTVDGKKNCFSRGCE
ncbi:ras-related protein Rab-34 [Leptinotarsa decemlineata]|uniref:ras-related protein Rab-34 n=1 Tax=Leptinotarsa decemlineata TaxID=7539 RepID=UPI003D30A11C